MLKRAANAVLGMYFSILGTSCMIHITAGTSLKVLWRWACLYGHQLLIQWYFCNSCNC